MLNLFSSFALCLVIILITNQKVASQCDLKPTVKDRVSSVTTKTITLAFPFSDITKNLEVRGLKVMNLDSETQDYVLIFRVIAISDSELKEGSRILIKGSDESIIELSTEEAIVPSLYKVTSGKSYYSLYVPIKLQPTMLESIAGGGISKVRIELSFGKDKTYDIGRKASAKFMSLLDCMRKTELNVAKKDSKLYDDF